MSDWNALLEVDLPKWPQMLVTGEPVTVDQAKEIIFLTDSFLTDAYDHAGGNAREFNARYRKAAGLDRYSLKRNEDPNSDEGRKRWRQHWVFRDLVRKRIGVLETLYVTNEWASCAFIFGPHGWCSPTGQIGFIDNVGKWPTVSEVLTDWQTIAKRFPFVKLTATLMDGEQGSDQPLTPRVNIVVADGVARLEAPDMAPHVGRDGATQRDYEQIGHLLGGPTELRELGLPLGWYDEFATRVRVVTDAITDADLGD